METKELMIEDWVYCYGKPTKIAILTNGEIIATKIGDGVITPIPLTPEILEKNGIKNRDDKYIISGLDDAGQWYITLKDFKPQFDFWFIKSSNRNLNVRGQIRYVHELQHVLRLVGLTELANNFKV